ncbi:ester cyclase [Tamlana sp. 2_MG-2023]|uniref:ester cyclase n=1 Tax=unclassified Tamlana TaxID=2614803 RepID=UPI0026E26D2E|nr:MULTISPECIES: ester cyclase [unclassified Tamlana]MDO6761689.1 ester cyclase [Tamlana sp. 2_MG-2023]MDO6792243.1 ester cyclase [Tamlana sp. 1_MG-2023]
MKQLQNKEIIKEMYDVILNRKEKGKANKYIDNEYLSKFNDANKTLFESFPDILFEIENIYGDNDNIVTFYNWTGTHKRGYKNIASTGNNIKVKGVSVYLLKNGKVINSIAMPDKLMFFQQLGLIPKDLLEKSFNG